ncbi:MAG: hypothetical protein ACM33T_16025 [Solirubrobacterales bacterium]
MNIGGASVTGAIAQSAVAAFLRKRMEDARDVLLDEFETARIHRIEFTSQDELGGVLFRYFNAIRDNAARLNMRLMAKVMVSQAHRGELFADPFSQYAAALACLTRDEVIVLAALMEIWSDFVAKGGGSDRDIHRELNGKLVPTVFPTVKHVSAALASASKSGLLFRFESPFGNVGFYPSPLLEEVVLYADFQDALRKEKVEDK